ncbi:family 43 glycosylhydrolase [Dyadobacter aurulentus]|uniref:family 43 glycosylhydrolase n=1 Tax=Dyadobacter sp. UC 10 TaxID=2605428 RepID=UPI001CECC5FC|nr:family 43 glycosylhydrolase [Dyadobacter sp. UC 10]
MRNTILLFFLANCFAVPYAHAQKPRMMFGDTTGTGIPYSKDPVVVNFKGKYLMYFSIRKFPERDKPMSGWAIGIAESRNLTDWKKIGEILPEAEYEKKGLCAPGALLKDGKVHLFYQTYGNGPKDAICHATSEDGIHFTRNKTNPIFRPAGDWNNGRAIDAEVYFYKNKYFLYFATRDPEGKIQMQGVATAPAGSNFDKQDWTQATAQPILKPELPWEGECVEGASVIGRNGKLYMFYAGAYNNWPQQIGLAVSEDGIKWERATDIPFLPNGKPGEWNSSESGHPCIFEDTDGKTYLFYQGNPDKGKSWLLSNVEIGWNAKGPYIKQD